MFRLRFAALNMTGVGMPQKLQESSRASDWSDRRVERGDLAPSESSNERGTLLHDAMPKTVAQARLIQCARPARGRWRPRAALE